MDGEKKDPTFDDKMILTHNRKKLRNKLLRTACNAMCLLMVGITMSMKGPTFLDIQMISGVDVEKGSAYFTIHAFGYLAGSLLTGTLYHRFTNKSILVIVSIVICAFLQALTPWCANFVLMLLVSGVPSVFWAVCETTVNTVEVRVWEGKSDSAMQFLSFAYSLGGIIGPLIVEPFLAPRSETSDSFSAGASVNISLRNKNGTLGDSDIDSAHLNTTNATGPVYHIHAWELSNETSQENIIGSVNISQMDLYNSVNGSTVANATISDDFKSNIHYAYLITAVLFFLSSIPFCFQYWKARKTSKRKASVGEPSSAEERKLPLKVTIMLMACLGAFYFFYTTVDDSFSLYLPVFVVSHLDWSKEKGAVISSLYWGSSTAAKLAIVVLIQHVNPSIILLLSTVGMVVSTTLFTISAHFQAHTMIWVFSASLAIFQSSVFGGGFAWFDAHLLKLEGRVTSCAMIFSSLGAMVDPIVLGITMKELSPMSFPILLTFQALMTCLLFLALLVIAKPYVTRKYGPPRPNVNINVNTTEEETGVNGDVIYKPSKRNNNDVHDEEENPML